MREPRSNAFSLNTPIRAPPCPGASNTDRSAGGTWITTSVSAVRLFGSGARETEVGETSTSALSTSVAFGS